MTDFFLHYVHHKGLTVGLGDGKELKEKVIWWIQHATDEERSGFGEVMLCKQMTLDEWLDKFGAGDGEVDELGCLCGVQVTLGAHCCYNQNPLLEYC